MKAAVNTNTSPIVALQVTHHAPPLFFTHARQYPIGYPPPALPLLSEDVVCRDCAVTV
jgi:hypothetical protein